MRWHRVPRRFTSQDMNSFSSLFLYWLVTDFIVMWFTMNRSYYRWFIKWSTFSMRADCVLYYQTCVYIIIVWNGQKRKVVFVSVGISCSLVLCCCPQISLNHEIYFLNQLITNFMLLWQQGAQRINGRLCGTAEGTKIKLR